MVAQLNGNKDFSFDEFKLAIEEARIWAAQACTTFGGAGNYPDEQQKKVLLSEIPLEKHKAVSKSLEEQAEEILTLIEIAFRESS